MTVLKIGDARVFTGDCLQLLKKLPENKFRTCVTSPPYFGLRDYGMAGQLGLETTPEAYVQSMVEVFREVRRTLTKDGTLWLNIGDSYAANRTYQVPSTKGGAKHSKAQAANGKGSKVPAGMKQKDLIGIPWMLAFALRADGWYLRQDVIWHKPNPMPESVRDRCTKAHEYIFLFSKSPKYYFDGDSIKEPSTEANRPQRKRALELAKSAGLTQKHFDAVRACGATDAGKNQVTQQGFKKNSARVQKLADEAKSVLKGYYREFTFSDTKNRRSVWTIATKPYKGAHFATFPTTLVEPCVLAGSAAGDFVLDPFNGSGTTGQVALEQGRKYVGLELNPEYVELTKKRLKQIGTK